MLTRIYPHMLDEETINFYLKAVETDEHSGGVEITSKGIYHDALQLWIWETEQAKMVVITQVMFYPDGTRHLLVSMLAGRGGFKDYPDVVNEFAAKVCSEMQCEKVIAYVKPNLWRIFQDHGAEAEELYMVIGKDSSKPNDSDTPVNE